MPVLGTQPQRARLWINVLKNSSLSSLSCQNIPLDRSATKRSTRLKSSVSELRLEKLHEDVENSVRNPKRQLGTASCARETAQQVRG